MIEVLKSGFYSSIQDLGRFGYRDQGVPYSGVMDSYSAKMANLFTGNTENEAVIEMTMTGPSLLFHHTCKIAICGADMKPKLNGKLIEQNKTVFVPENSTLEFGHALNGVRTYLSIQGGIFSENILGSRSFCTPITLTNRLEKGDVVQISKPSPKITRYNSKLKYDPYTLNSSILKVHKGPEFSMLPKNWQKKIINTELRVTHKNSRMGYQLEPDISSHTYSILTSAVLPGTVQWTPSGQLIVLMRDGQTTGGYPRVLQLTEDSINILAQKRAADTFGFQIC